MECQTALECFMCMDSPISVGRFKKRSWLNISRNMDQCILFNSESQSEVRALKAFWLCIEVSHGSTRSVHLFLSLLQVIIWTSVRERRYLLFAFSSSSSLCYHISSFLLFLNLFICVFNLSYSILLSFFSPTTFWFLWKTLLPFVNISRKAI